MNRREEYIAFLLAGINNFQPKRRGSAEDLAGDCLDYAEFVANGAMATVEEAQKNDFQFEEEEDEKDEDRPRGRRR